MTDENKTTLPAQDDEWIYLSLEEVTRSFGVTKEIIIEIVNEGVVTVEMVEQNEWRFNTEALRNIRTSLRLQRDLGVNIAGTALAIELLKEIERLKTLLGSVDH